MKRFVVIALLIALPVYAQTPVPATPEQRIASQLGVLIIQNVSLSAQIEQLQLELNKQKALNTELEKKCKTADEKK